MATKMAKRVEPWSSGMVFIVFLCVVSRKPLREDRKQSRLVLCGSARNSPFFLGQFFVLVLVQLFVFGDDLCSEQEQGCHDFHAEQGNDRCRQRSIYDAGA